MFEDRIIVLAVTRMSENFVVMFFPSVSKIRTSAELSTKN